MLQAPAAGWWWSVPPWRPAGRARCAWSCLVSLPMPAPYHRIDHKTIDYATRESERRRSIQIKDLVWLDSEGFSGPLGPTICGRPPTPVPPRRGGVTRAVGTLCAESQDPPRGRQHRAEGQGRAADSAGGVIATGREARTTGLIGTGCTR